MKRFILGFLATVMLICWQCPIFGAETIGEITEQRVILEGVTYKNIRRITTSGWLNINVLEADLNNEHLSMDVLTHANSVAKLDQTSDLADRDEVVGAINADFFAWSKKVSGGGSPIGPEVSKGELMTTTGYEAGIQSVVMSLDKIVDIGQFKITVTAEAPDGTTAWVRDLNKYSSLEQLAMYNRSFGTMSPAPGDGVVEMVVENDTVKEIRYSMEPVEIPENGYILSCIIDNRFLVDKFQVGDPVKIKLDADFDLKTTQTMVGGGALLLEGAKLPAKFSHNISGMQPRSALGVDDTGRKIYLVTVDGRQNNVSVGVTQTELAYIMAELGAYKAINFDGGGSTTMALHEDGATSVVNSVSDGSERAVANAVGIVTDARPTGEIAAVQLYAEEKNVFVGTSMTLEVRGYDIYKYKTYVEQADVTWEIEGVDGYIENNMFYPKSAGEAVLKAYYGGNYDILNVTVLDTPSLLEFTHKQFSVSVGESAAAWLRGYDAEGRGANIFLKDTQTALDSDCVTLSGNRITAEAQGQATLTAILGDVAAYLPIGAGMTPPLSTPLIIKPDTSYGARESYSSKFAVFGNTRNKYNLFEQLIMNKTTSALNREDNLMFSAFVGDSVYSRTLGNLNGRAVTAGGYDFFVQSNNAFLKIDNGSGTFMGSGQKQWSFIKKTVSEIAEPRVFIFMPKETLDNEAENQIFYNLVDEHLVKNGKQVYIFTNDDFTQTKIKNGIHVVGTQGFSPSMSFGNIQSITDNLQYVLVYVGEDGGISYEYKKVF